MNGPNGMKFPWGKIIKTHSIGSYDIVEFKWSNDYREYAGKTGFSVFANQQDINQSAFTLEGALLLGIAWAHGDMSAARYMAKMIGIEES